MGCPLRWKTYSLTKGVPVMQVKSRAFHRRSINPARSLCSLTPSPRAGYRRGALSPARSLEAVGRTTISYDLELRRVQQTWLARDFLPERFRALVGLSRPWCLGGGARG